jgi:molybdopterin synthase catalytic subunit
VLSPPSGRDWIAVTAHPLPVDVAIEWVTTPGSGAVVCFLGVVRDRSEGREGVRGLTYEAYEAQAERRLSHRVGELALSEPSVAVVVSSPHRPEAFEAARFCIDTLKETAPIWKREHWEGGSDWAACGHTLRPVRPPAHSG